jgi:hypothetical protein
MTLSRDHFAGAPATSYYSTAVTVQYSNTIAHMQITGEGPGRRIVM